MNLLNTIRKECREYSTVQQVALFLFQQMSVVQFLGVETKILFLDSRYAKEESKYYRTCEEFLDNVERYVQAME